MILNHVVEVKPSHTAHRITCDEGYVIIERSAILYVIVPLADKKF